MRTSRVRLRRSYSGSIEFPSLRGVRSIFFHLSEENLGLGFHERPDFGLPPSNPLGTCLQNHEVKFLDSLLVIFEIERESRGAQVGRKTLHGGDLKGTRGRRSDRFGLPLSNGDSIFQKERPHFETFVGTLGCTQLVSQAEESFHLDGLPSFQSIQDVSCRLFGQAIRIDVVIPRSQHTQRTISVDSLLQRRIPLIAGTRQDTTTIGWFQEDIKEIPFTNFGGIPFDLRGRPVLRIAQFSNIHNFGRFFNDLLTFRFGQCNPFGFGLVNQSLNQGFIPRSRSRGQCLEHSPRLENARAVQGIRKRNSRSNCILKQKGHDIALVFVQRLAQLVPCPNGLDLETLLQFIQDFIPNIQLGG